MAEVERDPARSSLFWDLYEHHAALLRAKGGGRFRWRELTARAVARGLTDANGNLPDWQTTKKTWQRVCELKAREQAERNERRRVPTRKPERGANADRPPPAVTISTPRPPVPSYPPPSPAPAVQGAMHSRPDAPSSEDDTDADAIARAKILRLRRLFAERSGHDPEEIT